ncbi:MAG: hypothetical protein OHK0028_22700 [Deltaproteobacteria bacterium]
MLRDHGPALRRDGGFQRLDRFRLADFFHRVRFPLSFPKDSVLMTKPPSKEEGAAREDDIPFRRLPFACAGRAEGTRPPTPLVALRRTRGL